MFLGRVIGEVWATKKMPDLEGKRLLVIQPLDENRTPPAAMVKPVVAADPIGADVGENVIVAFGKAARVACGGDGDYAFEAAIVGVVDEYEVPDAPDSWREDALAELDEGEVVIVGTVIGNVWATQKEATLEGLRFLVVRPFVYEGETAETIIAVDPIGAGIGERVLVTSGRAARHAIGRGHDIGFQSAIVGIIDSMELDDGRTIGGAVGTDTKNES